MHVTGFCYASSAAAILSHEELGRRIDGGGRSDPHEDAHTVARVLAGLPEDMGGRAMAIRIVELAQANLAPDWWPHDEPRSCRSNGAKPNTGALRWRWSCTSAPCATGVA